MTNTAKVFATCLILAVSMQMCCGSAIPIWEFLTRNEKMSYLYSTFAQLVSVHCKATAATSSLPVNHCKHSLLGYGYEKLQTFSDAQLDLFDPYQRGASELIWSSIMRDHPSSTLITTRKPLPTPPASSIIILTQQQAINKPPQQQQQHTSASTPTAAATSGEHHQFGKNPIFENGAEHRHQFAMDMDIAYGYPTQAANPQIDTFNYNPQQQQQQQTQQQSQKPAVQQVAATNGNTATTQQQQTYLTGPLVFRVRPDGTPVEEDRHNPLPRDDDLEEYHRTTAGSNTYTNNNKNQAIANNNNSQSSNNNSNNNGNAIQPQKQHRRIATISALKQQHLATLALQQQLQPPLQYPQQQRQYPQEQLRLRRQFQYPASQSFPTSNGYFYGRTQA